MYTRILVAVDGSKTSDAALAEALELAKSRSAQVRVVHVIDSPYAYPESWYTGLSAELETLRGAWRQAGQRVLDAAAGQGRTAGVPVETLLLEASGERLSDLIVRDAERWPADLIVVGTHGRRGLERLLLGSVAEGIVRTAPGSVLLVRGR